ncbi:MAG: Fe-S-containing protein [Chloroflexota bacterium]
MSERDSQNRQARSQKRSRFEVDEAQVPRRNTSVLSVLVLIVGVAVLGVGLFMMTGAGKGQSTTAAAGSSSGDSVRRSSASFTTVTPKDGVVALPVSTFADGKARFYTMKQNGKEIDFFVLKSSDGVIRAGIDACDVCFPAHKGYHQEGDEMVCNNCGQRFASVKVNEVKGGCNPSPLTRDVQGDTLFIQQSDIISQGGGYF